MFGRLRATFTLGPRPAVWLAAVGCLLLAALPAPAGPLAESGEGCGPGLAEMAGSMLMVGFRGLELAPDDPVYVALAQGGLGGVILFNRDVQTGGERNIASPEQVRALTAQIRAAALGRALIAVDQEGGRVQRLTARHGFAPWPPAAVLGEAAPARTYARIRALSGQLAALGINLNFAPCVDLDYPGSPAISRLQRAFSSDPGLVAAHARAFASALNANGIISCLKHFPGHGSALADTHHDFADITRTWEPDELVPYRTLIAEGYSDIIMAAHVTLEQGLGRDYGPLPASLNPGLLTGLLREELGWRGVIATDDLDMGAIARHYSLGERIYLAVAAGADLLVFGNNLSYDPHLAERAHAALMEQVAAGRIPAARIRESWLRLEALRAKFN